MFLPNSYFFLSDNFFTCFGVLRERERERPRERERERERERPRERVQTHHSPGGFSLVCAQVRDIGRKALVEPHLIPPLQSHQVSKPLLQIMVIMNVYF